MKPKPRAQRLHCAFQSPTQEVCPIQRPPSSLPQHLPRAGWCTSRSVSEHRRQVMQASMASCQGSSSASGKSTSRIRILERRGQEEREMQPASQTPLLNLALTTPSPQNGQVQGLVGHWSVKAPHQHEEGLGLPLKQQQQRLDLTLLGPL